MNKVRILLGGGGVTDFLEEGPPKKQINGLQETLLTLLNAVSNSITNLFGKNDLSLSILRQVRY